MVPQLFPSAAQVVFLQQVWFAVQVSVAASQVPHARAASPQPAGEVPHIQPVGQVVLGAHTPQMLAAPAPPQVSPFVVSHPPQ
jgi:hypothetical protein